MGVKWLKRGKAAEPDKTNLVTRRSARPFSYCNIQFCWQMDLISEHLTLIRSVLTEMGAWKTKHELINSSLHIPVFLRQHAHNSFSMSLMTR